MEILIGVASGITSALATVQVLSWRVKALESRVRTLESKTSEHGEDIAGLRARFSRR